MGTTTKKSITVEAIINAPVKKVWEFWTDPKHIIHWNQASHDWHTPKAENDLRVGGNFSQEWKPEMVIPALTFVVFTMKLKPTI